MIGRSLMVGVTMVLTGGSALTLATFTLAIGAAAEPMRPAIMQLGQRRSRQPQADWLRSLNLTPEQLQQIQTIRKRYQDRMTTQRQAVRAAQQDLKQLMASNASAEQIRQQFDQLQALKQKLADTRMESMLAIRNVLNAEQRQQLHEVMRQLGRDRGN